MRLAVFVVGRGDRTRRRIAKNMRSSGRITARRVAAPYSGQARRSVGADSISALNMVFPPKNIVLTPDEHRAKMDFTPTKCVAIPIVGRGHRTRRRIAKNMRSSGRITARRVAAPYSGQARRSCRGDYQSPAVVSHKPMLVLGDGRLIIAPTWTPAFVASTLDSPFSILILF